MKSVNLLARPMVADSFSLEQIVAKAEKKREPIAP